MPPADPIEQKTLLGYLWGTHRRLRRGVVLALARSLAAAPGPWIFQQMIDGPLKQGKVSGVLCAWAPSSSAACWCTTSSPSGARGKSPR